MTDTDDTSVDPDAFTVARAEHAWSTEVNGDTETVQYGRAMSASLVVGLVTLLLVVTVALVWLAAPLFRPVPAIHVAPQPKPSAPPVTVVPPPVTVTAQPPATITETPTMLPTTTVPSPDESPDADFLRLITKGGWAITDRNNMIQSAHAVCDEMSRPPYPKSYQVAAEIAAMRGITFDDADTVVAASITIYCPQYHTQLN